jgi:hypothetical protein
LLFLGLFGFREAFGFFLGGFGLLARFFCGLSLLGFGLFFLFC